MVSETEIYLKLKKELPKKGWILIGGEPPDGTNSMPLTVSIGMAACTVNNPEDPDLLIKMADKALYEAKNSGRNRVVVFNPQ